MVLKAVKIKMCGMTQKEDIHYAASLGVDAIGLIFYPGSKRAVTMEQAKLLLKQLPIFIATVAVMVNPLKEDVEKIIAELPVQWLQFHGRETEAFCNQFKLPYIKAIAANSTAEISQKMEQYRTASAFLLDTPDLNNYGGSGLSFDWGIIPEKRPQSIILAGGLNANNIEKAIHCVSPYAVDVCSGIEQAPGIKDHHKMLQFVNALRGNK